MILLKRYGKMSNPEISIDGDLIFCAIESTWILGKVMDNGIKNDATVSMDHISDLKIKNKFVGLKKMTFLS